MNPKIHSKWASGTLPDPLEAPLSLNRLPAPLQERSKEAIKTLKRALVSPNAWKTTPKLHQNGNQSVHLADFKQNPRTKTRKYMKKHTRTRHIFSLFMCLEVPKETKRPSREHLETLLEKHRHQCSLKTAPRETKRVPRVPGTPKMSQNGNLTLWVLRSHIPLPRTPSPY